TTNTNRASYRFDDLSSDINAEFSLARMFHLGVTGGYYQAHTATSGESGLPPINDAFPPEQLTGFGEDTQYTRVGAFAYVDSRDSRTGPRRGSVAGVRYREYWDVERKLFTFRQTEFEFQQYIPYYNRSRVVALRAAVVLSFPRGD